MAETIPGQKKEETKRERLNHLRSQLIQERETFIAHWRELGNFILPRRPRFTLQDVNKGERRSQNIIDSTATLAFRTLRAGMMGGITSPARPWFRLSVPDQELAEDGEVKAWLDDTTEKMRTVFLRSNLYNVLPVVYGDLSVFSTGAMSVEEDFDDVIRCTPYAIGSYMIANDNRMKVNVWFREFRWTVRQVVQEFCKKTADGKVDLSNVSEHVKDLYKKGSYEIWVDICHVIQPNEEYDPTKLESKFKKFQSCYYEKGVSQIQSTYWAQGDNGKYLRESGFDYFPVLVPRWEVTDGDAYGTNGPGMESLGDIKQLQIGEKKLLKAVDKMVDPPMTGPTALNTVPSSLLPGGQTWVDTPPGQDGFRPAHQVDPKVLDLEKKQEQCRVRISRAAYEDLFLMLAQSDRREITAREIEERHEEKLLALGPVLEQLNQDLLNPLIDIVFAIMVKQGLISEPPEAIAGTNLKVEYISPMAQAQKLVGISGIERGARFVIDLATAKQDPAVFDKIDTDQMIDEYFDAMGTPASIVRPDDVVEQIRTQREKAIQAEKLALQLREAAAGAKDLANANLEKDSALKRILDQAQAGQLVPAA